MDHTRAHLGAPGWSLVRGEPLTKKLPMFLSRLNEKSGCCEKIVQKIVEIVVVFVKFLHPSTKRVSV